MARDYYRPHRRNFTAGEISDILSEKVDFSRYVNGCFEMLNMVVIPQGASTRRSGTKFLYDLTSLGPDITVKPKCVPFIFSRTQAYALVFFKHTSGTTRFCLATKDGLVESTTPGVPYVFEFTGVMDIPSFDYAQSNDVIKIAQYGRTPLDLSRLDHNEWEATEIVFTSAPSGASGWSAPDNWPRKVGFFEQRIAYAATKLRPQTIWFSKSANFSDFGTGETIVASDAVTLTFNSGTQNTIEWLNTGRQLIVGTLGDEWTVSGKGVEPLSFQSFLMNRHTRQGSESLKPIMIGPVTIFVEQLGKTVNQFVYDYATDSYDVVDLSILAPHLTEENRIVDWTYQKAPNGIIWAVRDDGVLIALTMKREHNVIGWHRHTTDGKFLAVTAIPGVNETDLFTVVERVIDGSVKWYIEMKAKQFVGKNVLNCRFLDSFSEYSGTPISVITGLDHLEGKEVSVLANGRPQPNHVVINGEVSLDKSFSDIVVGLPFKSRLSPTPSIVTMEDGLSKGLIGIPIKTVVSVKDSSGFSIGVVDESGRERLTYVSTLNPELVDDIPIPLITKSITVDLPESASLVDDGLSQRIIIEQSMPLPLTVRGLTDHIYFPEA